MISISTTIQVSEETQKRLFRLINSLEQQWGRRISYNEAILFLLRDRERKIDKGALLQRLEKYRGILPPGAGDTAMHELRELEHEREKHLAGN